MTAQLGDLFKIDRATLSQMEIQIAGKIRQEAGLLGTPSDIDAFVILNSSGKFPLEIVRQQRGSKESLPLSVHGKTQIRFVGQTPLISAEPDKHGNLEMTFVGPGAVEVIFNSLIVGAAGRNRGPQNHKKLYIIE